MSDFDLHAPYLNHGARPRFRRGNTIGCLCVHGFAAAPTEIDWLADHLHHTLGMTTYTVRLDGHGTDHKDMHRMTWHEWYMSVRDAYQVLADQCDEVVVAGISMGGLLSLLLCAAGDAPLSAAAIMAAPIEFKDKNIYSALWLKYIRRVATLYDRTNLPQIVREEQYRRGEPVIGRTHYEEWSVSAVSQLIALSAYVRTALYQIENPLTLIYADKDDAVPLSSSDYIAAHTRSTTVEQHIIAGSRHIITQDTRRDEAFQLVEDFFRRQTHATDQ
jgi:carboxylesterase